MNYRQISALQNVGCNSKDVGTIVHFMRRPRASDFSIERLYEDVRGEISNDINIRVWTCKNFSKGIVGRFRDMLAARRAQGSVNHVTGDVHYLAFLLNRNKTVITIHDTVLLEVFSGIKKWAFWLIWYWLPVYRSKYIVTVSEETRASLIKCVPDSASKISVIHNCISNEFVRVERKFNAEFPKILLIGTGPNKNLDRSIQALSGVGCSVVIVGMLNCDQVECLEICNIAYENYVSLGRGEMFQLYATSDMVLFASTYEGFGLPIVEAQAVGRPVVTSNVSSMPEIAGEGAWLVDPFDVMNIRAGILRVISDDGYRAQLVAAGFENAKRFSASSVAKKYEKIYRTILER